MRLFILSLLIVSAPLRIASALGNTAPAHASEQGQPDVEVLTGYRLRLTLPTSASPETIWAFWEDVENWKQFDRLLEYSNLDSGHVFESGASGYIKASGASRTRFRLSEVERGIGFTETLFVPLYQQIALKRYVRAVPASDTQEAHSLFTHEVVFKGRLRFLAYALAASSFKKELPLVMGRLRALAEERGLVE